MIFKEIGILDLWYKYEAICYCSSSLVLWSIFMKSSISGSYSNPRNYLLLFTALIWSLNVFANVWLMEINTAVLSKKRSICKYRVSQKKNYTFIALNFRSLLNIYANLRNIYLDSIAFWNCNNHGQEWPRYGQYGNNTAFSFWPRTGSCDTDINMFSETSSRE